MASPTVKLQRKTKLYTDDGSTEVIIDVVANTIKIITFVGGDAYKAPLYNEKLLNKTTGVITEAKFYLHRDYQGTIIAISNNLGVAVEKRAFDAWGNLAKIVNSANISLPVANGLVVLDRGYTSHEHLQEVRLLHMNGRLYDPVLRSFLMPDNFVQQPENTQNYNRYAYVMNNPLRYTDPSGELFGLDDVVAAMLIGAVIGALTYTATAYFGDTYFSWSGLASATFIGAASAAVTFGIGSAANDIFTASQWVAKAGFQAVAHGTFQGLMTEVSGGKFWSGFAAGALSSIAASAWSGGDVSKGQWNGLGGKFADSGAGMIAFGTIAGGTGAALTGGNFWVGAVTGLVVSGLNHAMHSMRTRNDPPNKYQKYFSRKLDEIKNGYGRFKPLLRASFDAMEIYGGTAEATGLLAAPFTEGASLLLAEEGAKWSLYGTMGNTTMDFIDGDFEGGFLRLAEFGLSAGMGKAFEAIPFKTLSNVLNGYKAVLETTVVPALKDSWNKFNPPANKLKL